MNAFEQQVKKHYEGRIAEREIVGAFHACDLETQGHLSRNNFLYCITAYVNKLLTGEEMARRSQPEWNQNSRSQYQLDERGSAKKSVDNFNELSKAIVGSSAFNPPPPPESNPKYFSELAKGIGGMNAFSTPGGTPGQNPYLPKDGNLGRLEG